MEVPAILQCPAETPTAVRRQVVLAAMNSQGVHQTLPELDSIDADKYLRFDIDKDKFLARQKAEEKDRKDLDIAVEDAECIQEEFLLAIKEYQRTLTPEQRLKSIATDQRHTWEEVLETIEECHREYQNKATVGFWGKMRYGFRKFGENSSAFESWLGLIPSQDSYMSIICGGLKVIIRAAGRINRIREEVVKALEDIPDRLCETQFAIESFSASVRVKTEAIRVYVELLRTLDCIIKYFNDRPTNKVLKAIGRADRYEYPLVEALDALKRRTHTFKEHVKLCSYEVINQTGRDASYTREIAEELRSRSFQNLAELSKLSSKVDGVEALFNTIYGFLLASPNIPSEVLNAASPRKKLPPAVTSSEVIEYLKYSPEIQETDLHHCMHLAAKLNIKDQNRAVEVMRSHKVQNWVQSLDSQILLINGNGQIDRRSPLSFVCAKLINSLVQAGNVNYASFFCGEHQNEETDSDANPPAILINMIGQLLEQRKFDLSKVKLENIDCESVSSLMKVFKRLVSQLSRDETFFCVIDGIGYFEDRGRREETCEIVGELVQLVSKKSGPVLKVLLTCPTSSRAVHEYLYKDDVYTVPKTLTSRGGFRSLNWDLGT
ncbi:hypothetical protein ABW19_dt0207003 [Dactylella cylindrospora]|nr:hypothetical protein ABW19_dt0207003 [Dactylella cylindrospora]